MEISNACTYQERLAKASCQITYKLDVFIQLSIVLPHSQSKEPTKV